MTPTPPLRCGEDIAPSRSTFGAKVKNGQLVWLIIMIGSYAALLTTWAILALAR